MTNIFSISLITVQYFFPPCTYNFTFSTCVLSVRIPVLYCCSTVLCFTANVTLLHQLNDEFDGVWISCGLGHRFRCGYDGFGFYDHLDIMTKMVWSQSGHIKRRLLYTEHEASFIGGKYNYKQQENLHQHYD